MKVQFLYKDKDWMNVKSYSDSGSIIQDLGLKTLFSISAKEVIREKGEVASVSQEDKFLALTMQSVMMVPLESEEEIVYRQEMIQDAWKNADFICEMYQMMSKMLEKWDDMGRKVSGKGNVGGPKGKLLSDIDVLSLMVTTLSKLKKRWNEEISHFRAPGFLAFYERLCEDFSEEKEAALRKVLADISFYGKDNAKPEDEEKSLIMREAEPRIVMGCNLSHGLRFDGFVLEDIGTEHKKFRGRNSVVDRVQDYVYAKRPGAISLRKNLDVQEPASDLEYAAVRFVVSACDSFVKDYKDFFDQFRFQVGFLRATVNLKEHMKRFYLPYCFPKVCERENMRFANLKEFVMAIEQRVAPVGNTCDISDRMLLIVTGANQGGKSTFLRSVGIAQVMMQCGLPVTAENYESGIFPSFFTHFTRREDSAMNSGRLDEELKRMSQIVDNLGESSMVLLNESFASTTEKEGSVIAYDIIKALTEAGVKVLTVTHLLSFAQRMYQEAKEENTMKIEFFTAQRTEDGSRTFKMIQHEPELTSFGMDLYERVIGEA